MQEPNQARHCGADRPDAAALRAVRWPNLV